MAKPKPNRTERVSAGGNISRPAQQKPGPGLTKQMKLALLLALISFVVYANTLKNGYVYDDITVITENSIVQKGVSAIPELLSTPYHLGHYVSSNDLYRPLSLAMFATEVELFGLNPLPSHFINVLLFSLSVLLLFLFLDRLMGRKRTAVAFIAALLFALHPIHTEVVANIKSRDELLCFFLAFLSLNIFLKYLNTGKLRQLLLGAACFFLSMLSKETVITFAAIVPLIFFFYRNENKKRSAYISVATVIVVIICLAIRFSVLSTHHANDLSYTPFIDNALASKDISAGSRIASAVYVLGYYLKLLFVPYPLVSDYSYHGLPYVQFTDVRVIISLAIYIALIVYGTWLFSKSSKSHLAFGILFFLATISLFSNIPFLIGTMMGERLLFFPSVGFCLVLALLIEKVARGIGDQELAVLKNKKALAIVIPIAIVFFVVTVNRNGEWLSNYTLFSTDVKTEPQVCKLNYNLGLELINMSKEEKSPAEKKKLWDEGMRYVYRSIIVYPDFDRGHAELCNEYFKNNNFDSAEVHGKKAILLDPNSTISMNNLAGIHFSRMEYEEAMKLCRRSIKIKPSYADPYTNLAACYLSLNKIDSGIYYLYKSISIAPDFSRPYEYLAKVYSSTGKPDSAKKYEAIAKKNNPGFKL